MCGWVWVWGRGEANNKGKVWVLLRGRGVWECTLLFLGRGVDGGNAAATEAIVVALGSQGGRRGFFGQEGFGVGLWFQGLGLCVDRLIASVCVVLEGRGVA